MQSMHHQFEGTVIDSQEKELKNYQSRILSRVLSNYTESSPSKDCTPNMSKKYQNYTYGLYSDTENQRENSKVKYTFFIL